MLLLFVQCSVVKRRVKQEAGGAENGDNAPLFIACSNKQNRNKHFTLGPRPLHAHATMEPV